MFILQGELTISSYVEERSYKLCVVLTLTSYYTKHIFGGLTQNICIMHNNAVYSYNLVFATFFSQFHFKGKSNLIQFFKMFTV